MNNLEKINKLRSVLTEIAIATDFEPKEYLFGEQYSEDEIKDILETDIKDIYKKESSDIVEKIEKEIISILRKTIFEFSSNGMINTKKYLVGEGYSISEIEQLLSK